MRLGQLARKLALRPSQIVDYLATQQVFPDEGSNARLSDEVTGRVVLYFAPERLSEILTAEEKNQEPITAPAHVEEEPVTIKTDEDVVAVEVVQTPLMETTAEKSEVIKAPKVELTGLKVLGKIELPEPKKKTSSVSESMEAATDVKDEIPVIEIKKQKRTERKEYTQRNESFKQRSDRNPIAEQRERQAKEEDEKRKAKVERDKQKRTQHYLQRVKTGQPTKSVKIVSEPVESFTMKEVRPAPKTWWGKFMRWLNT